MEWTSDLVRRYIQRAIELELFTIPGYLSAYYSIDQSASEAAERSAAALLSIANEEMLHVLLLGNISIALGRSPTFTGKSAPSYPGRVPLARSADVIALGPATDATIRAFMKLELPITRSPYAEEDLPPMEHYETIGEAYSSIRCGLFAVFGPGGEAWPEPSGAQVNQNFDHDRAPITDVEGALRALDLVVLQGEGASVNEHATDDPKDLAHYYKLESLLGALSPGDLLPVLTHDRKWPMSARCEALLHFFDACYSGMLRELEASFKRGGSMARARGWMFSVIQELSMYIVRVPHEGSDGAETGKNLAPRYTYTTDTPERAYAKLDERDKESETVKGVKGVLTIP